MYRPQIEQIAADLLKKMAFIVGPRQVGKTWLAQQLQQRYPNHLYLNYDDIDDRVTIRERSWSMQTELLILDELHKMPGWKNFLKGTYDTKPDHLKILVTGSARIDIFRQVGDALTGRFFTHHLLPLSVAEIKGENNQQVLDRLLERGGFPEAYLAESAEQANRWRLENIDQLIRDDVLTLDSIQYLQKLRLLVVLLQRRVGSLLSVESLRQDLDLTPATIEKYLRILEALYIIFRIRPFSRSITKSIRKQAKVYFYDVGMVQGDEGTKLENLVAVSLLKHCLAKRDYKGQNFELCYLRTKESKEVDFCLVKDFLNVEQMIEVKWQQSSIDANLHYFYQKYNFKAVQVVHTLRQEQFAGEISVRRAADWLAELEL